MRIRGLTLIEMLLVLAIGSTVIAGAALATTSGFERARTRADRDTLAALLRQARVEAMAGHASGFVATPHGVAVFPDRFVLFSGLRYESREGADDEPIPRTSRTEVSGEPEAIFAAGSGLVALPTSFMLQGMSSNDSYGVLVNADGGIEELP